MTKSPKHSRIDRDRYSYLGNVNHAGVFVRSGSISSVTGGTTGSVSLTFDAIALRVRRVEVFHSGAAGDFNLAIENRTPNTGSAYDPRNVITCYNTIPGSDDWTGGLDQVEDLLAMTDTTPATEGDIYIKFMPYGAGSNDFKYLMFFEAAFVYVNKDGSMNG
jgi:hypothetical protein